MNDCSLFSQRKVSFTKEDGQGFIFVEKFPVLEKTIANKGLGFVLSIKDGIILEDTDYFKIVNLLGSGFEHNVQGKDSFCYYSVFCSNLYTSLFQLVFNKDGKLVGFKFPISGDEEKKHLKQYNKNKRKNIFMRLWYKIRGYHLM